MQDSGLEMKYIVELYKLWLRNKIISNMVPVMNFLISPLINNHLIFIIPQSRRLCNPHATTMHELSKENDNSELKTNSKRTSVRFQFVGVRY
jgi:hypothetical protein